MLQLYDTRLLLIINGSSNPLLDNVFWYITSDWTACAVFIIVAVYLWHYRESLRIERGYALFIVFILLAVILSDLINTYLFKPLVMRLRPSHEPLLADMLHLVNDYRGGMYGFYSSHASNSAVLGVMTAFYTRHKYMFILLFLYVFLFGFSRLYLGVHYPSDLLMGWFMGSLLGIVAYKIFSKLNKSMS